MIPLETDVNRFNHGLHHRLSRSIPFQSFQQRCIDHEQHLESKYRPNLKLAKQGMSFSLQRQKTKLFLQKDVVVVDRGLRDCVGMMEDLGLNIALPIFLDDCRRFTTAEANQARYVTKVRCVVEAANATIKQFKFLANTVPNSSLPYPEEYLSIVCSIINRYQPPMKKPSLEDGAIAEKLTVLWNQRRNSEEDMSALRLRVDSLLILILLVPRTEQFEKIFIQM